MAEIASLARPYVKAVFDIAQAESDLAGWSDQLEFLSVVAADPQIATLDGNPRMSSEALGDLVIDVCGDRLSDKGKNLVRLLASNRRLSVVGEIAEQYELLRAEAENQIDAEVVTATSITDEQRASIAAALEKRLGRTVKLETSVNEDILGGAVIRAGDWVFDGSIRAQLQKMASAVSG
ncbi:MAG: F-type H+-transporting ATPase subunit delta [Parasphingorhabdus sp.]|jgi:F-type H+-transporting ATPase subunit delta